MPLSRAEITTNVRRGVRMGLGVAIGFSLIAAAISLAIRGNAFETYHLSFVGGIVMYFVVGLCVGVVGGVLTPIMRSNLGLAFAGLLLAWIADSLAQIAMKGPRGWRHYSWFEAVLVAVTGIPGAFYYRASLRRAAARARGTDSEPPS
jgi:hypothetical protein